MFRPWRLAALPLAATFLLASACSDGSDPASPPTNPPADAVSSDGDAATVPAETDRGPRRVTIIGDSISLGSAEELPAAMPLDDVEVIATSGIRLGPQRAEITRAVTAEPDVLVIELGTNDVPVYEPAFLDEIDDVLDETDQLPCVRWVTVYAPNAKRAVTAVNDHLEQATSDHDNLRLVDWFTLVDDDPSLLSADGLHPDEEGQRVLAQAIAVSTATCNAT